MPVYEHSTNLFKKLRDEHEANIYHPDRNSTAAKCYCECNNKQWSTIGNEKCWGQKRAEFVHRLHTKYPILCSRYRRKRFIKNSATHRLPPTSFVTLGSLMERRGDRGSLHHCQKSRQKSHKAWQIG